MYKSVNGGKNKHDTSDENGKMLINFAAEQKQRSWVCGLIGRISIKRHGFPVV